MPSGSTSRPSRPTSASARPPACKNHSRSRHRSDPSERPGEILRRVFRLQRAQISAANSPCRRRNWQRATYSCHGRAYCPPGLRPLVMQSPRAHGHARVVVQPRLHCVTVEHKTVDAARRRPGRTTPSWSPGWASHRSSSPEVHDSAPVMRFAIDVRHGRYALARYWNMKLFIQNSHIGSSARPAYTRSLQGAT